jgi:hypothetical protein
MRKRMMVLGPGIGCGLLWSALLALSSPPSEFDFFFAVAAGGPVAGTAWGIGYYLPVKLGWVGLLLMPAHCCCPNLATACVTILGLVLWFFAGFVALCHAGS